MSLYIQRAKGSRAVKKVLHRVADIPGGVTIKTTGLTAGTLIEGTPIAKGGDGLFEVVKYANVVEAADATATEYKVAKGTLFASGDSIAKSKTVNVNVTSVDKTNEAYDIITVDATLGAKAVNDELLENSALTPIAVTGTTVSITPGRNVFVDAWVIAVVRGFMVDGVAESMKGVTFIDY